MDSLIKELDAPRQSLCREAANAFCARAPVGNILDAGIDAARKSAGKSSLASALQFDVGDASSLP